MRPKLAMRSESIALVFLFVAAFALGEKKSPVAKPAYPAARLTAEPCDALWRKLPAAAMRFGFVTDASDRAGGFLKLRYTRGDSQGTGARNDVEEFTTWRTSWGDGWQIFRLVSVAVTLLPADQGCNASLGVEYQGFKTGGRSGWTALQSNGYLENTVLAALTSTASETK